MATVVCQNCNAIGDDMDAGSCLQCGMSLYEEVAKVFDNGKWKLVKGDIDLDPEARAAFLARMHAKMVADLDRPVSHRARRPARSARPPLHPAHGEDYGWVDDLTSAVARAQDVYEKTYDDWNRANTQAMIAQERIQMHSMDHRALGPAERHEYVTHQSEIAFAHACFAAYERARERYFRLLNELGEAEQPSRALASRRRLEDPSDPYRDTRRDDGSLAWLQRHAEAADRDRRSDRGPARGFNPE
jgi:hypothetical protein